MKVGFGAGLEGYHHLAHNERQQLESRTDLALLRSTLEALPDGVAIIQGVAGGDISHVIFANSAFAELLGVSIASVLNKHSRWLGCRTLMKLSATV